MTDDAFDLDLTPYASTTVRINTPDGPLVLPADMDHVLAWRVSRWLEAYRPFISGQGEGDPPSMDDAFEMAAEAVGKDVATVKRWGSVACVRLLDFLLGRFLRLNWLFLPTQTNGSEPAPEGSSSEPTPSPQPRKSRRNSTARSR